MHGHFHRTLVCFVAAISVIALLIVALAHQKSCWINGMANKKAAVKFVLLEKVVTALERAIDHLFGVGESINVDGVFGVRLVGEQLSVLIHQVEHRDVSVLNQSDIASILHRIKELKQVAKKFTQQFHTVAEKNNPEDYEQLSSFLLEGSWDFWYSSRDVDQRLVPTYDFRSTIQEVLNTTLSDKCLSTTYTEQCNFTEECWNHMTAPSYHGYSLTHQVLYILNAIALGCEKQADAASLKWKHETANDFLAKRCAAILHEAELIASKDFPIYLRDLFLEQVGFCGMLGYRDFFRKEWLYKILKWQSEKGCYAMNQSTYAEEFARDFPHEAEQRRLQLLEQEKLYANHAHVNEFRRDITRQQTRNSCNPIFSNEYIPRNFSVKSKPRRRRRHRQKRNEQYLLEGCLSHLTAVALAALGQYVRYILESFLDDRIDQRFK